MRKKKCSTGNFAAGTSRAKGLLSLPLFMLLSSLPEMQGKVITEHDISP